MTAEEILSKYPSRKIGLDDHYGKQTTLRAMHEFASQKDANRVEEVFRNFIRTKHLTKEWESFLKLESINLPTPPND